MQVDSQVVVPRPVPPPSDLLEDRQGQDSLRSKGEVPVESEPILISPPPIPWPRVFPGL